MNTQLAIREQNPESNSSSDSDSESEYSSDEDEKKPQQLALPVHAPSHQLALPQGSPNNYSYSPQNRIAQPRNNFMHNAAPAAETRAVQVGMPVVGVPVGGMAGLIGTLPAAGTFHPQMLHPGNGNTAAQSNQNNIFVNTNINKSGRHNPFA